MPRLTLWLVALAAVVATGLGRTPAVQAGCLAMVIVDGREMIGMGVRGLELPPPGRPVQAVVPGCNDTNATREPDRPVTVRALRGIPPTVAVVADDGKLIYVAHHSLTALQGHPLRGVLGHRDRTPDACRSGPRLRGDVVFAAGDRLTLEGQRGERLIAVDRRTRLVGRPVTDPLVPGQPVAVATRRCGRRLVARRIAFTGPPPADPRARERDRGAPSPWRVGVVGAVAVGMGVAVGRSMRRRPRRGEP